MGGHGNCMVKSRANVCRSTDATGCYGAVALICGATGTVADIRSTAEAYPKIGGHTPRVASVAPGATGRSTAENRCYGHEPRQRAAERLIRSTRSTYLGPGEFDTLSIHTSGISCVQR